MSYTSHRSSKDPKKKKEEEEENLLIHTSVTGGLTTDPAGEGFYYFERVGRKRLIEGSGHKLCMQQFVHGNGLTDEQIAHLKKEDSEMKEEHL